MTPAERRAHENRAIAALDKRKARGGDHGNQHTGGKTSRDVLAGKQAERTAALVGVSPRTVARVRTAAGGEVAGPAEGDHTSPANLDGRPDALEAGPGDTSPAVDPGGPKPRASASPGEAGEVTQASRAGTTVLPQPLETRERLSGPFLRLVSRKLAPGCPRTPPERGALAYPLGRTRGFWRAPPKPALPVPGAAASHAKGITTADTLPVRPGEAAPLTRKPPYSAGGKGRGSADTLRAPGFAQIRAEPRGPVRVFVTDDGNLEVLLRTENNPHGGGTRNVSPPPRAAAERHGLIPAAPARIEMATRGREETDTEQLFGLGKSSWMGGPNSTRWRGHVKATTVEDCFAIDTHDLLRTKLLVAGTSSTRRITWTRGGAEVGALWLALDVTTPAAAVAVLTYESRGIEKEYRVALTSTPVGWGGLMWWWRCPAPGCRRMTRKLYLAPRSSVFSCRVCGGLAYWSSQTNHTRVAKLAKACGL